MRRAGCRRRIAQSSPTRSSRRTSGATSPTASSAPAGSRPPLMMDMANTGVARGKIYLARQRRETIPLGWALDAEGAPTTDPQRAIDGIILPMAGHKGYAIATVVDLLSGVLSGS